MVTTVALAGLAITIGPLSVGQFATSNFGSAHIGNTVAFTAFALCLIAAAIECRSEIGTALTTAAFDSKQMNWAMLSEFALAVLVSQMNVFHRLLGTTDINLCQFGWALIPPSLCWRSGNSGKLIARRSEADADRPG